jgi:hypothetical protein
VGFLKAACSATARVARRPVLDTARLARRCHPRRGAQLQARQPGPVLPGRHDARPPGAVRRARHRRRAARADRAARQPRRPLARRAAHVLLAGLPRPAAQAAPRRGPAAPAGVYLFATSAAGCSTSASPATCARGCAPTSPRPRPAAGWPRWSAGRVGRPRSSCATALEAEVRELRSSPSTSRATTAARVPRARPVAQAHRRAVPRLSRCARSRTTARLPRARSPRAGRSSSRWRGARGVPAAAVHAAALTPPVHQRVRARRDGSLQRGRARVARRLTSTPCTSPPAAPR